MKANESKIVDGRRKHHHHGCLEDANKVRMRAQLVSRSVPKPPFPHPDQRSSAQGPGRVGTYDGRQRAFVSTKGGQMLFQKPRRPSWK
ncbi:MAG: hypothetical protein M3441_22815 [Chloroflexota bacterium]|jgi:hypothetical protein|nr:hypothetical protein [Chloroflexota bacterium]